MGVLITEGMLARSGWLPKTDRFTEKKTGWFGRELSKDASSIWNPFASPPTPTPRLSKELIYAGSRLLTVEDANARAAPPSDLAVWRPSSGIWHVCGSSARIQQRWGQQGDIPVPGDYDGDSKTDFSVYRLSGGTAAWYVINSGDSGQSSWTWGITADLTAPAD